MSPACYTLRISACNLKTAPYIHQCGKVVIIFCHKEASTLSKCTYNDPIWQDIRRNNIYSNICCIRYIAYFSFHLIWYLHLFLYSIDQNFLNVVLLFTLTRLQTGHLLHPYQIETRSTELRAASFFLNCLELISVHNSLVFSFILWFPNRMFGLSMILLLVKCIASKSEIFVTLYSKGERRRRHWDVENSKHVYAHCVWKFWTENIPIYNLFPILYRK